jgi:hypothetical protein
MYEEGTEMEREEYVQTIHGKDTVRMTHEDIEGDDDEDTKSTQKQHQADLMRTCRGLQ